MPKVPSKQQVFECIKDTLISTTLHDRRMIFKGERIMLKTYHKREWTVPPGELFQYGHWENTGVDYQIAVNQGDLDNLENADKLYQDWGYISDIDWNNIKANFSQLHPKKSITRVSDIQGDIQLQWSSRQSKFLPGDRVRAISNIQNKAGVSKKFHAYAHKTGTIVARRTGQPGQSSYYTRYYVQYGDGQIVYATGPYWEKVIKPGIGPSFM